MSELRPQRRVSILSVVIILLAVGVAAFLLLYRQQVIDTVRAWQFTPSASVAQIRSSLSLTPQGELYFNSSQPTVESADGFNQHCPASEPNNPVVGCYANQLIYIYDVKNEKLSGIEETTAAHELLHAAYERMSDAEKQEVNVELEKAYKSVKTKELETRMDYYEKNEPGEEDNELHSILGTEFTQLGTKLEAHYAKYFKDRKDVVAYYEKYQSVFADVTTKLDSMATSINSRTNKVKSNITSYEKDQAALQSDISALNARNASGEFSTQEEYDAERLPLIARRNALEARRKALNAEIAAINKLRKEYNGLIERYEELSRSINSSLEPAPSLSK